MTEEQLHSQENQPVNPASPFNTFGSSQQPLPNSTLSLVFGILSIPACCCYGVFGLILGIIAWVLATKDIRNYHVNPLTYTISSFKNAQAAKICGIVGTVLSALYLLLLIACLAIFGFAALKDPELMKEILRNKGY
jgi:M penetrans paralogue family 26